MSSLLTISPCALKDSPLEALLLLMPVIKPAPAPKKTPTAAAPLAPPKTPTKKPSPKPTPKPVKTFTLTREADGTVTVIDQDSGIEMLCAFNVEKAGYDPSLALLWNSATIDRSKPGTCSRHDFFLELQTIDGKQIATEDLSAYGCDGLDVLNLFSLLTLRA